MNFNSNGTVEPVGLGVTLVRVLQVLQLHAQYGVSGCVMVFDQIGTEDWISRTNTVYVLEEDSTGLVED